ncbi:MAG TPA: energy transducer TonB [Puia sp.]|nr:energy transducer TonB [Puia sp.]
MEINQILQTDLLDILFEGRNKSYGAYELRKTYNRRMTKALAIMASLCLLLIGGYTLAGRSGKSAMAMITPTDPTLTDVNIPEKHVEPPPAPKLPPVKSIAFVIPRIVKNIEVRPDEVPPTVDDMETAKIGIKSVDGIADGDIVAPPSGDGVSKGIVEAPKVDSSKYVFIGVQIESNYPGGTPAWQRFIGKTWHTPEEAIAKEVSGTVVVQFIVDREGNVSDVQAISGPPELTGEAIRVIKKSGRWNPGIQNGRPVNSYKKQPITVKLENE